MSQTRHGRPRTAHGRHTDYPDGLQITRWQFHHWLGALDDDDDDDDADDDDDDDVCKRWSLKGANVCPSSGRSSTGYPRRI